MSNVPPHDKRRSKNGEGSSHSPPMPELLPPLFNKNPKLIMSSGTLAYRFEDIFRWLAVGLDDRNQFPPSVHLQPVSANWKIVKHLALFNTDLAQHSFTRRPWEYIAENMLQDLLSSFEDLRSKTLEFQNLVKIRPIIIARLGKVLFRGRPSVNNKLESETTPRRLRSSFYTNVPDSYVEYLIKEGASKGGLEFEIEKDVYHVFLSDATQSDETVMFCKCRVLKEHGKLQMYKIKRPYVRHMLRDISCLKKNLDLRLDLCTKRTLTLLTDDDLTSIRDLIDSAILDTQVKGGLRWSQGKEVSGDKFCVSAVWHIIGKTYKNSSLSLKIKDVDQYDFQSSTGQARREVVIMLKGLSSELLKKQVDMSLINEMLKDDLKVLWNNFLCCDERFPT